MPDKMYHPKIAIVGCGAVIQQFYLPAFIKLNLKPTVFIDKNLSLVAKLSKQFDVKKLGDNYLNFLEDIDAVIIATPNSFHAPQCIDLLNQQKHVLIEKPMALNFSDSQIMIQAAEKNELVFTVGLMRRFFDSSRWVKLLLEEKVLGDIISFDFREGGIFNWPIQSASLFDPRYSGGGVLADTGAHTLDLLLWWLGEYENVQYTDDNYGGVEANCMLHLKMKSGAKGTIELSRMRELRNSAIIKGTKGEVEIKFYYNHIEASPKSIFKFKKNGLRGDKLSKQSIADLFVLELKNWISSICSKEKIFIAPHEAAQHVKLIEQCYANCKSLKLSWMEIP